MKLITFALLIFTLVSYQKQRQEIKLEGKYKMEYETEFASENCTIKIKGNKFEKKLNTGEKRKGIIEVQKLKFGKLFLLKELNSNLEVNVDGETYHPSDTIYFRTKRIDEKDDDSALIIYSGKLIKIK